MATRRTGPTFIQRSRQVGPEEKALYHEELGAGRSRVTRPFLALTARDEALIQQELERRITARLGR